MKAHHPSVLQHLARCEAGMHEAFDASAFSGLKVPAAFAQREGRNGVWATSFWWGHPSGAEGRCALIHSNRIEIINLMIFPEDASSIPIFASEIILMGGKVSVAVIDWQMAGGPHEMAEEDERRLEVLNSSWSRGLTHGGAFPDWALQHFSPHCIYARPKTAHETTGIQNAFVGYLTAWFRFCARRMGVIPSYHRDKSLLDHYVNHHVEHTPGRPFLSKVFGTEWAESYFRHFMYAPLGKVQDPDRRTQAEVKIDQTTACVLSNQK